MEVVSGTSDDIPKVEDLSNLNVENKETKQLQQKTKKKHRRGKPKPKNSIKPFKNTGNWKYPAMRSKYNERNQRTRVKLLRSNSLAPYNTNKFLMEEHMVEVPALQTPTGRTRDSSFSVDSEDNYFFSLPEDEEEFLSKEFSNVYERARVERLENMNKQQLIEECLQMEDRYANDQQQIEIQRITSEFMTRIKCLEQKIKELTRENYNLRCQLVRSTDLSATAASPPSASAPSPPSASAPTSTACQPGAMQSSEDTESDSDSSSSSSSSSNSMSVDTDGDYECSPASGNNMDNASVDSEVCDVKADEPIGEIKIDSGCNDNSLSLETEDIPKAEKNEENAEEQDYEKEPEIGK